MYDDELSCTRIIDGKEKTFYGDKAINLLVKKDKINFKKVRIHNNRMVMQANNTQVIFRDLNEMLDNEIFDYFYNNIKKINKSLNKKKNNKVSKGQVVGFATVGVVAAIMLALTAGKIKDRSSEVIPIEFDQDEENDLDSVISNIPVEPIDELAMKSNDNLIDENNEEIKSEATDPSALLDELDQIDEEQAIEEYLNSAQVFSIAYDNEFDEEKYQNVYDNCNDYIQVRAPRWGVSPSLAQGMVTQETGAYYTNLMQIQFNSWHDQEITLYNYETGKMETIILTNNPDGYVRKPDTQYITEKDLENPKTNISVGCIILQYSYEKMHHNIPLAIQCYNFGTGNMEKVLEEAALNLGISVDEILDDPTNTDWLEYRDIIDVGDKNYLEHVIRYVPNPEDEIWMNYIDEDGNIQQTTITFYNENDTKNL